MDFDDLNLDSLKDKAAELFNEHGDKIRDGIDKAADLAKDVVDKLAGSKGERG